MALICSNPVDDIQRLVFGIERRRFERRAKAKKIGQTVVSEAEAAVTAGVAVMGVLGASTMDQCL